MRMEIPFTGPAYKGESTFMGAQECVNFYPHPYPVMGKDRLGQDKAAYALIGTPGLESWCDLGTSLPIRGSLAFGDYLYAISGNQFFQVDTDGAATEKGAGTIVTTTGMVSMATNGLDILIVDGQKGYVYDIDDDTLTLIADEDFPATGATSIGFVDGYYFVSPPDTNQMHQSTLNDGTSWPGHTESAGSFPDDIVALIADHDELWPLCEQTAEIWYNINLTGFVLSPRPGAFMEQGCAAPSSPAKGGGAVYWLGRDLNGQGQVFQAVAGEIRVISTLPVAYQIAQYSDISDAIGFTYDEAGHSFYVLNFPTGDATWVYDASTNLWHERSSRTGTTDGRWRINTHSFFDGKHIVGDCANGKLYELKADVYDEDGTEMIAVRTSQTIRQNQNRITVNELQILMEPGVGLVSGQGSDPEIILSWSTDGGHTWGNEIILPIGKIGEYTNRAITPPLGQGRNWVFRMKISDPVKRVVLGASAAIEQDRD